MCSLWKEVVGRVKYFFDTEFIEDGKTIDIVSIGMVCEDGREFYRCNQDARLDLASDRVRANVLPQLPRYGARDAAGGEIWAPHKTLKYHLAIFLGGDQKPIFFAYYADYDWVALCQLFGTMMDLPSHFPKWCRDLKQMSDTLEIPRAHPVQDSVHHDALEDARWNRKLYDVLTEKP